MMGFFFLPIIQANFLLNHFNSVTCDYNNEDILLDMQVMFNEDELLELPYNDAVEKVKADEGKTNMNYPQEEESCFIINHNN